MASNHYAFNSGYAPPASYTRPAEFSQSPVMQKAHEDLCGSNALYVLGSPTKEAEAENAIPSSLTVIFATVLLAGTLARKRSS